MSEDFKKFVWRTFYAAVLFGLVGLAGAVYNEHARIQAQGAVQAEAIRAGAAAHVAETGERQMMLSFELTEGAMQLQRLNRER